MLIEALRNSYHRNLCAEILSARSDTFNIADIASKTSKSIVNELIRLLPYPLALGTTSGQSAGARFESITMLFLKEAFALIQHLRPAQWVFEVHTSVDRFEQYEHLGELQRVLREHPEMAAALGGDYVISPDIIIARHSLSDGDINKHAALLGGDDKTVRQSPLRAGNRPTASLLLHAVVSCKWTIRSDRAQNVRTEGLNLIRNRKGHAPHIVVVTAEPMPTRLASLAMGTGDLDCVYHVALPELQEAVKITGNDDQMDSLEAMVSGRRLRDISDLPFDLAI